MSKNILSIQFMRFVAAILVVFFHATQATRNNVGGVSADFVHFTELGASGVHIFFVISGFIMMYTSFVTVDDKFSPLNFFLKRFVRIYPIYWVCCVLYLSFHKFFGRGYFLDSGQILGAVLLLPGYSHFIIGPGWTLAYEIYFYLCFGVLMCLGLSRGFIALIGFFILSILTGLVFHFQNYLLKFFTNSLLIEFIFGALIAYVAIIRKGRIVPAWVSFCMQAVALIALILTYFTGYRAMPTSISWGIPCSLLIAGLVFNEREGLIWKVVQRVSFLGDSSYSLYLLHILLIDLILTVYERILPPPGSLAVAVCVVMITISTASAVWFHNTIEYNLTSYLRKLVRFRRGVGPKGLSESAKI